MSLKFRKGWTESGNTRRLIQALNNGTRRNDSGGITFTADDHSDLFHLLADGVTGSENLSVKDKSAISYRSFIELRKVGIVEQRQLESEMSRRARELLSSGRSKHTMWTKIRLKQFELSRSIRFNYDDVRFQISPKLPKWLMLDDYWISGIGDIRPDDLPQFGYLVANVDARNENEAAQRIYATLNTFFAIVNTHSRPLELWIQRHPTAKLWLGPHQFFYAGRRFLCRDSVWYNPDFDRKEWEHFPPKAEKIIDAAPAYRRALDKLRLHPMRNQIEEALRMVSQGMISKDLSYRLMRFWSAAECLYSLRNSRTPMGKIIDRMTFADGDEKWLSKLKLERAYHLRNQYVHHARNDMDDSSLVQALREAIIGFAYYLLYNGEDISSHEELIMMLDLPADVDALSKRARAIERKRLLEATGRHRS